MIGKAVTMYALVVVMASGLSKASNGASSAPGAVVRIAQTAAKPSSTRTANRRRAGDGSVPDGKTRSRRNTPAISGVHDPVTNAAAAAPAGRPASGFASSASSP